jgi:hypothetical protein
VGDCRASLFDAKDIEFTEQTTFAKAKKLVESTSLDLSDCFQILSIKYGYFSPLCNESATILVTADKDLSIAARDESMRVWYLMDESAP